MSRLAIVFLTIFIDLIGFGIVLPLLPFYAQEYGASGQAVGLLIGVTPGMQLLFAPLWGRLSDRHGRRPILLIGLLGSGFSYLVFAFAPNLAWLFASRVLIGVAGANVPVAQAYIADSTEPADRARGMGLVGVAYGLGFIAGPAIGGALSHWGYVVPGLFAAALCFGNVGAAYLRLPETLERRLAAPARRAPSLGRRLALVLGYARRAGLRQVMGIYLFFTLAFALFITVLPLFIGAAFGYGARHAGYLLTAWGLLMVIVQGQAIGPLSRRFGEVPIVLAGTAVLVLGYAVFPLAAGLWTLVLGLVPLALGTGLNWPSLTSLASRYAGSDEQGAVLGVMQSLSSFGGMSGAALGGWAFDRWNPGAPFLLNSGLLAVAALFALRLQLGAPGPPEEGGPEPAVRSAV